MDRHADAYSYRIGQMDANVVNELDGQAGRRTDKPMIIIHIHIINMINKQLDRTTMCLYV